MIGSLFTGYGGLDLAVEQWFGARTVWTSDIDPGASKIIAHRWPDAPNLGDLTLVDWAAVEPGEILTGGFPCQDVSTAGNRAGLKPGTRSGLWSHMAYAIDQLRPRYVVAENVRGLLSAAANSDVEPCPWCVGGAEHGEPDLRALGAVLGDLAALGYDAQWVGLRAADVGAPHGRFRVFVVATDTRSEAVRLRPGLRAGGPARLGWRRPDDHTAPAAADTESAGPQVAGTVGDRPEESGAVVGRSSAADTASDGRDEGWPEPARLVGRPDAAVGRDAAADAIGRGLSGPDVAWGAYEPAIRRWEAVSGRVAPAPTETGPKGGQRLSPRFVEWMMGLPAGWVTDVPDLSRNAQLKALGNGVVPQQAHEALKRVLG